MSDQFVAEIRLFPYNFAPTGWALCAGQLLSISQNTALFSLLGTTYGGNGVSNFALPDLRGRVAMQPGQGPGLSLHDLGEESGTETVTLLTTEMPVHTHNPQATSADGISPTPGGNTWAGSPNLNGVYNPVVSGKQVTMAATAITPTGGNQPHNNMQPYLAMGYYIALQGIFPPRA